MRRVILPILLVLFLSPLMGNAKQQNRPVKHTHDGKNHTHVLPNNGVGRHDHKGKRRSLNQNIRPVKHNHNGRFHIHVLPNNGVGTHNHSRYRKEKSTIRNSLKTQKMGNWIFDQKKCKHYNPKPVKRETLTWDGSCRNGLAHGYGVLRWFKSGVFNGVNVGLKNNGSFAGEYVRINTSGASFRVSKNSNSGVLEFKTLEESVGHDVSRTISINTDSEFPYKVVGSLNDIKENKHVTSGGALAKPVTVPKVAKNETVESNTYEDDSASPRSVYSTERKHFDRGTKFDRRMNSMMERLFTAPFRGSLF